jgi:hypothetical protein
MGAHFLPLIFVMAFLLICLVAPIVLAVVRTSVSVKWTVTVLAFLFFAWALFTKSHYKVIPCPQILSFMLYSIAAWRHWFHPTKYSPPAGFCVKCGYNLTGNVSGICPECGQPIEPPDQHTAAT